MNIDIETRSRRLLRTIRGLSLGLVVSIAAAASAEAQPQVYVANGSANLVTAIDVATQTVVAAIPVGTGPSRIAVSADGSRAYVTNTGSSSISVIDTASNVVVATIAVGPSPTAIAITPDGQSLYILTAGGVVEAVDTTLGTRVAVPTGSSASGDIAVASNGSAVYVAAGPVTVIDTATNAVVETFSSGSTGIELSPDGSRAYVVRILDIFGGGLDVVDLASRAVIAFVGLGMPGQLAMAPDGSRLYAGIDATWVDTGYGAGFFPGRTVAVIDTLTLAWVASIDLGATGRNWTDQNTPKAIVVTPDKRFVYIAVPRIAVVAAASVNTNTVTATVPVTNPGALGATSDGSGTIVPFVIDAVNDTATYSSAGGTVIANVLANDKLGGIRPTLRHVILTKRSTTHPALSLDIATGAIRLAAGAPLGVQKLVYRICERATPANCDKATVTVTVRAPYAIDAVDDAGTVLGGGRAVPNVLANDTLAGVTATLATVQLTKLSSTSSFIELGTANGSVFVSVGASPGAHTLRYRICELASPINCDDATVSITVQAFAIDAVDDAGAVTGLGGTAVANVLANDTFNGAPATTTRVALAVVSSSGAGVSLNTTTGAVSVAVGTAAASYTVVYSICEKASPANCDTATVSVTVGSYPIDAVNDSGRAYSKAAGQIVANVLANDWFAGLRATTSNVTLSQVSSTSVNIRLDVTDGSVDLKQRTDSGWYTLVYRICEIGNPANCDQATVSIDLSGGGI